MIILSACVVPTAETQHSSIYSSMTAWFVNRLLTASMRMPAAQGVAGSIPTRNKHLFGLQVVVSGLAVCVY